MGENVEQMKADLKRSQQHSESIKESIERAEAADKEKRQEPLRELASQAHNICCRYNHTDGCGWGYENDNWNGGEHKRWLNKIEKILSTEETFNPVSEEQLTELVKVAQSAQKVHPSGLYIINRLQNAY